MLFKVLKRVIERGGYERSALLTKLDVFFASDRITAAEYSELTTMAITNDTGA